MQLKAQSAKLKQNPILYGWIHLFLKVAILFCLLWLFFGVFFGLTRVSGVSMSSRVEDGDLVLFLRKGFNYAVGDVVLFSQDGKKYVSEIIAQGGDILEIDEEGYLLINHVRYSEDHIYDSDIDSRPAFASPFRVPESSYFVLNSNLDATEDSRSFGAIWAKNLQGKVISLLRTRSI